MQMSPGRIREHGDNREGNEPLPETTILININ
jgi:hypothetical protein